MKIFLNKWNKSWNITLFWLLYDLDICICWLDLDQCHCMRRSTSNKCKTQKMRETASYVSSLKCADHHRCSQITLTSLNWAVQDMNKVGLRLPTLAARCVQTTEDRFISCITASDICMKASELHPISHNGWLLGEGCTRLRMTILCRSTAMREGHVQRWLTIMYRTKAIWKGHSKRLLTNVQIKGKNVRHCRC